VLSHGQGSGNSPRTSCSPGIAGGRGPGPSGRPERSALLRGAPPAAATPVSSRCSSPMRMSLSFVRSRFGDVVEIETASVPTGIGSAAPVGCSNRRARRRGCCAERARPRCRRAAAEIDAPTPVAAPAFRVNALLRSTARSKASKRPSPSELALEDQYRRSEERIRGPKDLSAVAYAAWDNAALYLAVAVTKPTSTCGRPGSAHAEAGQRAG